MCDCKPGTHENGWHEERGESCVAAEREAFARAIAAVPFIAAALTTADTKEATDG